MSVKNDTLVTIYRNVMSIWCKWQIWQTEIWRHLSRFIWYSGRLIKMALQKSSCESKSEWTINSIAFEVHKLWISRFLNWYKLKDFEKLHVDTCQ